MRRSFTVASAVSPPKPAVPNAAQTASATAAFASVKSSGQVTANQPAAPQVAQNRHQTNQVSATAPLRSAATQKHMGTVIPKLSLNANPMVPLRLNGWGSTAGTKAGTVVIPPPQPLIPVLRNRLGM